MTGLSDLSDAPGELVHAALLQPDAMDADSDGGCLDDEPLLFLRSAASLTVFTDETDIVSVWILHVAGPQSGAKAKADMSDSISELSTLGSLSSMGLDDHNTGGQLSAVVPGMHYETPARL